MHGVIVMFYYVVLDRLPHALCSGRSGWKDVLALQFLKIGIVLLLTGYVGTSIMLYFFIPIKDAFEDAANNFISIYHSTFVFLAALVAYFVMKRKPFKIL